MRCLTICYHVSNSRYEQPNAHKLACFYLKTDVFGCQQQKGPEELNLQGFKFLVILRFYTFSKKQHSWEHSF